MTYKSHSKIRMQIFSLIGFAVIGGWAFADGGSWKAKLAELRKLRDSEAKEAKTSRKSEPARPGTYPWATPDDTTYVDRLLEEEWTALGFPVSAECTDGEFIRRASLDIIGRIPSLDEIQVFMKDKGETRRVNLINRLLASPEYGRHFANIWTDLMIPDGRAAGNMQDINPQALHAWLESQFNKGVGWNKIVGDLIGASGRWDEVPATNFLIANMMGGNSVQATSFTTKLFLGVQTQCVECHDHPWNEWKQDQFHGVNAFFTTTRERRVTRTLDSGQVATEYYLLGEEPIASREAAEKGTSFERRNGTVSYVMPMYLDGRDVLALRRGVKADAKSGDSTPTVEEFLSTQRGNDDEPIFLRKELAKVITADDNPYFARAIVNRMWYHFMGHSFIRNVDDFDNGQDEPSMPDLLDKLTEDFKIHNYDLKRLTRWICSSKAYSHSSKYRGKPTADSQAFFTTMLVKPLTPDQLYDSILTLTNIHRTGKSENTEGDRRQFRAEFERTFGTDQEQTGVPKFNGTITQSLMLMNSPLIRRATSCTEGTLLHSIAMAPGNINEKVETIYMAALARKPSGAERAVLNAMMKRSKNHYEFLEDVLWLVINSGEFVVNY